MEKEPNRSKVLNYGLIGFIVLNGEGNLYERLFRLNEWLQQCQPGARPISIQDVCDGIASLEKFKKRSRAIRDGLRKKRKPE